MAERTGLEPATSNVTGWRSNQLNYRSNSFFKTWWARRDSNPQLPPCKGGCLPIDVHARKNFLRHDLLPKFTFQKNLARL